MEVFQVRTSLAPTLAIFAITVASFGNLGLFEESHCRQEAKEYGYLGVVFGATAEGRRVFEQIDRGTPAEKAGLKAGDVLEGFAVVGGSDYVYTDPRHTVSRNPNRKMLLKIKRDGHLMDVEVRLTSLDKHFQHELFHYLRDLRSDEQYSASLSLKDFAQLKEIPDLIEIYADKSGHSKSAHDAYHHGVKTAAFDLESPVAVSLQNQMGLAPSPMVLRRELDGRYHPVRFTGDSAREASEFASDFGAPERKIECESGCQHEHDLP